MGVGSTRTDATPDHKSPEARNGTTTGARNGINGADVRVVLLAAHAVVRAGIRCLLDNHGIVVVGEASCPDDALAVTARERPDVVVIDPDSDQVTLAAVPTVVGAADSRVLVLTASGDAKTHARAIELGAVGVVNKDQPAELFVRAVAKVHAGEIWLDRAKTACLLGHIARRGRDPEEVKIETLTRREREIVDLVGNGLKNAVIAERLFISEATVRNHLTSILSKLELTDRFELAVYAYRHGLVELETPVTRPAYHTSHRLRPIPAR
jgi:DNA-binding NarL/FixJ family response regulator